MKYFLRYIILLAFLVFSMHKSNCQPQIGLEEFASGFTRPVDIAHADDSRLFVVEQAGYIYVVDELGTVSPAPFLDINTLVRSSGNEQGLLGLVFHPNYATNGFFYVNYTRNDGDTRISRFNVSRTDPNNAVPTSEMVLLTISQLFGNHNGGDLNFGPDGYLYIGLGDGGSGGDPQNNAQDSSTYLGKMLRIDVDGGSPYAIPSGNPFVSYSSTLDEIWAFGLRNPWRFSFDRLTGDLWIADVGQNVLEEINFQPANSGGGENYGWRCYEGNSLFNGSDCEPMADYDFSYI